MGLNFFCGLKWHIEEEKSSKNLERQEKKAVRYLFDSLKKLGG
jgi:hypothetical protein